MRKELDQLKKTEFAQIENELKKMKPEIEKSMKEAKKSIEKAKVELKQYKGFVDGLEKDGLINKNDPYTIEHKDGTLKINGKTQPTSVYDKYKSFLEKHKAFSLKKDAEDFDLDVD